jgi:hypothetical protein
VSRATDLLRHGASQLTRFGLSAATQHGTCHRGDEHRYEQDQPRLLDRRGATFIAHAATLRAPDAWV